MTFFVLCHEEFAKTHGHIRDSDRKVLEEKNFPVNLFLSVTPVTALCVHHEL